MQGTGTGELSPSDSESGSEIAQKSNSYDFSPERARLRDPIELDRVTTLRGSSFYFSGGSGGLKHGSAQFLLSFCSVSAQFCSVVRWPMRVHFRGASFLASVFARQSWWVHAACIFATSQHGQKKNALH